MHTRLLSRDFWMQVLGSQNGWTAACEGNNSLLVSAVAVALTGTPAAVAIAVNTVTITP